MSRLAVRWVLIMVGAAAQLGIAVLGYGGLTAFFSRAALIALVIVLFAMSVRAVFAGGNLSPGVREDRGNRWALGAFAVTISHSFHRAKTRWS
jgi:hypothetical protein